MAYNSSPYGQPGYGQPGQSGAPGQPPYGQPNQPQPGMPGSGTNPSTPGQPGGPGQPLYGQPGYGQPNQPQPGASGQPPYGQPGYGQPNQPQPGMPGSGTNPSTPGQPGGPGQPLYGQGAPPPGSYPGGPGSPQGWYEIYYSMIQPHEHQQAAQWFYSVDTDRSGSISGNELAGIQFNGAPLGAQVGYKLISVFDNDHSGTIDLREYSILHKFLTLMQNAFTVLDTTRKGVLPPQQIFQAIQSSGFQVSLPTVQAMAKKFDPANQGISFPTYLWICAHLANTRSLFERNDPHRVGNINLNYDQLALIATDIL